MVPTRGRVRSTPHSTAAQKNLDLGKIPTEDKSTPIITHCGGGGRGQKAKDYLTAQGFTNVANGGGPEDDECWAVFGAK